MAKLTKRANKIHTAFVEHMADLKRFVEHDETLREVWNHFEECEKHSTLLGRLYTYDLITEREFNSLSDAYLEFICNDNYRF